jgi:hypothetical protein
LKEISIYIINHYAGWERTRTSEQGSDQLYTTSYSLCVELTDDICY